MNEDDLFLFKNNYFQEIKIIVNFQYYNGTVDFLSRSPLIIFPREGAAKIQLVKRYRKLESLFSSSVWKDFLEMLDVWMYPVQDLVNGNLREEGWNFCNV